MRPTTSTPASSSSTTATTRTSSGCSRRLGVAWQPSDDELQRQRRRGDFEYSERLTERAVRQARPPAHAVVPSHARRPGRASTAPPASCCDDGDERLSLRHWLERARFSSDFVERLIVPQAAAVWSADPDRCGASRRRSWPSSSTTTACSACAGGPAGARSRGGSASYVDALTRRFARAHLRSSAPVRAIARDDDHVLVTSRAARRERFDESSSRPTRTRRWRCSPTPATREREILGALPYQANEAVLHTDSALLPRRRRAWASWNYHLLEEPSDRSDGHLPHEPPAIACGPSSSSA